MILRNFERATREENPYPPPLSPRNEEKGEMRENDFSAGLGAY